LPGYLLVPATGPALAFPDLFSEPLSGWLLTAVNRAVVEHGSSVYSVFPSLHVLITCALLAFDRRHCPRRFKFMLLPTIGLFASTMYLRYHYAIDLLAGAGLFLVVLFFFGERRSADVATGN
jgi:membrane-associated phospholipid phosphatase